MIHYACPMIQCNRGRFAEASGVEVKKTGDPYGVTCGSCKEWLASYEEVFPPADPNVMKGGRR